MTFLTFLLTFFIISPASPDTPDKNLHEKCLYPTIMIEYADNGIGTGIILRSEKVSDNNYRNVFVTCAHVVDMYSSHTVRVFNYKNWSDINTSSQFNARIFAMDDDRDLAIGVFYSDKQMAVGELDFNAKIFTGNDVFRIGCGAGEEPRLDYGKITSVNTGYSRINGYLRTSIPTIPGDSGSPVFNNYKIVGIMRAIALQHDKMVHFISYAVHVRKLQEWNNENNDSLSFAWNGNEIPRLSFHQLDFFNSYSIEAR